jgi:hypothetical protein
MNVKTKFLSYYYSNFLTINKNINFVFLLLFYFILSHDSGTLCSCSNDINSNITSGSLELGNISKSLFESDKFCSDYGNSPKICVKNDFSNTSGEWMRDYESTKWYNTDTLQGGKVAFVRATVFVWSIYNGNIKIPNELLINYKTVSDDYLIDNVMIKSWNMPWMPVGRNSYMTSLDLIRKEAANYYYPRNYNPQFVCAEFLTRETIKDPLYGSFLAAEHSLCGLAFYL